MDFTNLLSATIRLADTYDLARTPGLGNTQVGPLDRRKGTDGRWFRLATLLIEYLHRKDLVEPMAYHLIEPFVCELEGALEGFNLDDVRYMVNFLSKEHELKFHESEVSVLKGTTPLIDKKNYGYSCRLAPNGFNTISLALTAEELLYGDQIALQIKKALELGDFDNYLVYADRLINTITNQSLEVVTLLEYTGQESLRKSYHNKSSDYLDTLENIQETATEIRELLNSSKIETKFLEYLSRYPDKDHYEHLLPLKIEIIENSLLAFSKNLSLLVGAFYKHRENPFPTTDFQKTSLAILADQVPDSSIDGIMSLYGLWGATTRHTSPDTDLFEKLPATQTQKVKSPVFNNVETILLKSKLEEYIEQHSDEIASLMKVKGCFSLNDALGEGHAFIEEFSDLTSVIGMCLCTEKIRHAMGGLIVVIDSENIMKRSIDNYEVLFNDLILKPLDDK